MLFSSLTFLFVFLPTLMVFYFIVKNRKIRNLILLIFSLIFYAWGEPKYILLMITVIIITYFFGILIDKYDRKKMMKKKKISFIICLNLILLNLIVFKYADFLIVNLNSLFNLHIREFNLLLPVGISFYTFQILSYIIDLYRHKVNVQKNIFSLSLYVSLFPQLIAGPIVRYETIENEILNRKETLKGVVEGFKRFIIGLSKKILLANEMGLFADMVFNDYNNSFGTWIIWLGSLAYTFQIYFDFSGYSDMGIGLGKMFGFNFLENFNYPYIAKSITEFWHRWHISLSTWFRDYVYIPLGGNRVSKAKWLRNILIVWFLTGLWHGAAWNFIIWGLFYGILLIIEKLYLIKKIEKIPSFFSWLYTFLIIVFGWMIFRVNNLKTLAFFAKNMLIYRHTDWYSILASNLPIFNSLFLIIPSFIFSLPIFKHIHEKYRNNVIYIIIENIFLLGLLFLCIIYLTSSKYNPFIYFRF